MKEYYPNSVIILMIALKKAGFDLKSIDFRKINEEDASYIYRGLITISDPIDLDLFKFSVVDILDDFSKHKFTLKVNEYTNNVYIDDLIDSGKYDQYQLRIILRGRIDNINTSIYEDPKYDYKQMNHIYDGIMNHIDMKKYVDDGYDDEQLDAICDIQCGSSLFFVTQRDYIPSLKEEDLDIIIKHEYTADQMKLLAILISENREYYANKINIDEVIKYFNRGFSNEQLDIIVQGIKLKLDVSIYAKLEYNVNQMREIYNGLYNNIDVSIYTNSTFDAIVMRIIRHNIELFTGKNKYACKYLYNHINRDCLNEIIEGIKDGVDVSIYAKPEYDHYSMRYIRYALMNYFDPTPIINAIESTKGDINSWKSIEAVYNNMKFGKDCSMYTVSNIPHDDVLKMIADNGFDYNEFIYDDEM